jgi:hypothetical protein
VQQRDLEAKAVRLMRITRAALLYLILGITVDEATRRQQRGTAKISGTRLPLYDNKEKK